MEVPVRLLANCGKVRSMTNKNSELHEASEQLFAAYRAWAKANGQPILVKDDCGCNECSQGNACPCALEEQRPISRVNRPPPAPTPALDCGCGPHKSMSSYRTPDSTLMLNRTGRNAMFRPGGYLYASPGGEISPQPNANQPPCGSFNWGSAAIGAVGMVGLSMLYVLAAMGLSKDKRAVR